MKLNLNVRSSLLSIWDSHVFHDSIYFPPQNFALQVLFSNSLGTNNRPLGNWKQSLCTILSENILHYGEHESCRWGFSLRLNPLKNWVLSDGSVSIFACSHFVQRMSITPHQISARRRVVYSASDKRITSLTMTQVFRMFHKSRNYFTNDWVLCTDSIQSIKDTLMTQWGRLGLVTVCVHCCSIFWWGIKHNKPCLAFSSYPISQEERKKHLSKDSYLFEGVFVISVPPLLGWF